MLLMIFGLLIKKIKKKPLTLHCIYYLILLFMASCCNVLETMCTRLISLALAHGQHQLYVPGFHAMVTFDTKVVPF